MVDTFLHQPMLGIIQICQLGANTDHKDGPIQQLKKYTEKYFVTNDFGTDFASSCLATQKLTGPLLC